MLYFLFGPDTYRSREKLKELIKKYQDSFEIQKINGQSISFNELRNKIASASLLSTKRLFVIENLSQNKSQREMAEFFRQYKLSKGDILIFYEEEVDKKTSLYKFLSISPKGGGGGVFEFDFLKGEELKKWARDYVKNNPNYSGGKIEPAALEELLMTGNNNNLWALSRELDKLLAYNKNITLENVRLLTQPNFDDNIFNLTDAIGHGDKVKALELLNRQLETGMQPIYLLSMIIRQFRILIQVKELAGEERFVNYNFVAKELGLHPFVVQKSIAQSKKYSFEELEKIYRGLQEVDLKLKTSKLSAESLFNFLIIKI